LSFADEPGSTAHSVQEIILHPDWNSQSRDFDADISIVVLRDPVEFSRNVEPICLPQPRDEDEVFGTGSVVDWNRSRRSEAAGEKFDSTPNELEIPVVNHSNCVLTANSLVIPSSPRTFCAGHINESKSACSGDSDSGSGGFYILDSSTKLFSLQGIVSASMKNSTHGCDANVFSLYTNVAKFVDWIRSEMDKSEETEWIELNCTSWSWET
jgi:secreted trypsin-like serine protease